MHGNRIAVEGVDGQHVESLRVADEIGARVVAFPAISTGVYGYPLAEAAPIALGATAAHVARHPDALDEVRFVLFDAAAYAAFATALAALRT